MHSVPLARRSHFKAVVGQRSVWGLNAVQGRHQGVLTRAGDLMSSIHCVGAATYSKPPEEWSARQQAPASALIGLGGKAGRLPDARAAALLEIRAFTKCALYGAITGITRLISLSQIVCGPAL